MKLLGIVAEYNPFHTGHRYHIEKAKAETAADGVVVVMSGSFVQRGEPAVYDKWTRAFHAISHGADLVLELPAVYSTASADGFAFGAVETLRATGVVDTLSFGSECGDIDYLRHAIREETPAFRARLKQLLQAGNAYAKAYHDAGDGGGVTHPNDILATAYLKYAGDTMHIHTVKRVGAAYHDKTAEGEFASACAMRERLFKGENCDAYMPYPHTETVHKIEDYTVLLSYALRMVSYADYSHIPKTVRARIAKCEKGSWSEMLESAKTKNISMSSIKRALMQILIQNTVPPSEPPQYIRVLGFTKRGTDILKDMKEKATLPVITRAAGFSAPSPIWETEQRATDVYFMPYGILPGEDMRRAPIQI